MSGPATSAPVRDSVTWTICLCSWYVVVSAALINFNKFMMNEQRFPFAMALTLLHVITTFVSCSLLYLVRPSMFPAMSKATEHSGDLMKMFIPVSLLFIVGVVCSNQAYIYCSVAFLQFMKEWNVALVFVLSCAAGFQECDRVKLFVIMWVVVAGATSVTGDMRFSHLGFIIQVFSQVGETSRIVIQDWLLSGRELRLDPLTYQIFVGPPTIAILAIATYSSWDPSISTAFLIWWPYLLANASCAVVLNVTISVLIKSAGGVGFVLSGIVKDVVIVCSSSYIAGKLLNTQQISGFVAAMVGIFYWGMLKADPQNAIVAILPKLLHAPSLKDNGETQSLLDKHATGKPEKV